MSQQARAYWLLHHPTNEPNSSSLNSSTLPPLPLPPLPAMLQHNSRSNLSLGGDSAAGSKQQAQQATAPRLGCVPSRLRGVWRRWVVDFVGGELVVVGSKGRFRDLVDPIMTITRRILISTHTRTTPPPFPVSTNENRYAKQFNALPGPEHEGLRQVRTGLLEAWRNHLLAEARIHVHV